jgi:hypothetical protein
LKSEYGFPKKNFRRKIRRALLVSARTAPVKKINPALTSSALLPISVCGIAFCRTRSHEPCKILKKFKRRHETTSQRGLELPEDGFEGNVFQAAEFVVARESVAGDGGAGNSAQEAGELALAAQGSVVFSAKGVDRGEVGL